MEYISPSQVQNIFNKTKEEINNCLIQDDNLLNTLSMEHQLFIEGKNYNEELGLYIIFPENKNENFEFNDNGIIDFNGSYNLKNALLNDKNSAFDNSSNLHFPFDLNNSKVSFSSISSKILKNNINDVNK